MVLLASLAGILGCEPRPSTSPRKNQPVTSVRGGGDLAQALESLRKIEISGGGSSSPRQMFLIGGMRAESWQLSEPSARTLFYLNQWLNRGQGIALGEWKADKLLEGLPRSLQNTPGLSTLDRLEFMERGPEPGDPQPADLTYLQQALWFHDIASRVRREPPPAELAAWLKEVETGVGLPESEKIAAAERLFDWTIRNVQLDPLPPPARGPEATPGESVVPAVPALLGELGPGYAHTPYELLVQGRGDAHERGRFFIQLCRQAGIDAVMLARIDEQVSTAPQPWLPAILVGKQLYLFDSELGLPVPGPGGKGIATLAEAVADSAVLKQLDLPGGAAYPQTPEKLKNVVALIDAEPEALAHRMLLLQKELPSKQHLILSVNASGLRSRLLQDCPQVKSVRLWHVPLEAILYQYGRPLALRKNRELFEEFSRGDIMYYMPGPPLLLGRSSHLQGQFENLEQLPGARKLYLDSRLSDERRDLLYSSEQFRHAMGFTQPLPADEQQKKALLETLVGRMQRVKEHATYWLGLTYYESGKYETAIEWLEGRVLKAPLPSPWMASARYNVARSYEALGQLDRAIALLEADDSPQQHGNKLRAAWLKNR
ncbi:MAG: CDC27 family protein [Planctomycetaceae bacterium]|nr:CDC27 family protein [Planctomycetaceae bacterium]